MSDIQAILSAVNFYSFSSNNYPEVKCFQALYDNFGGINSFVFRRKNHTLPPSMFFDVYIK